MMTSKSVQDFYDWLVPVLDEISRSPEVQAALSQKLASFDPKLRWETGPSENETRFLAFSPGLDVQLLPVTEKLASAAPEVPGWLFLPAKPRKHWRSRAFTLNDSGKQPAHYNLDGWKYYLVAFKGGEFFDVNLIPSATDASELELQRLGDFLVQSELGEKIFLEFVDRVNILRVGETEHPGNNIEYLYDQLLEQITKHTHH
jgi:hypothetical protein